jgi:MFS family permease
LLTGTVGRGHASVSGPCRPTQPPLDRSYAALLRLPSLKRLLAGMLVARIGNSMVTVAIVLFTLTRYHSPALTGVVTFTSLVPGILFSPIAGALLDRAGRIRLVIFDYATSGLALLAIGALDPLGLLPFWALLLTVALSSVTSPLSNSGLRSLFPILVPRHLWQRVNVVDSNVFVVAQLIGPPIAGALITIVGGDLGLVLIGTVFVGAAMITLGMPEPPVVGSTHTLFRDAWDGIVYSFRNPTLRGINVGFLVSRVAAGVFAIVVPVILLERLGSTPVIVGIGWGLTAATQFLSALIVGRIESGAHDRTVIALSLGAYGVGLALLLLPPSVPLVLFAMAATGALNAPASVTMFTLRQRRTDPAWMGRAFAISMSVSFAGYPVGTAVAGALVEQSLAVPLGFGLVMCLIGAGLAWWLIPRHIADDALIVPAVAASGPAAALPDGRTPEPADASPEPGAAVAARP